MRSQKKIPVAVIGAGIMGYNHIRTYSKMSTVTLVAVADIDEKRGRAIAEEFNTRFYKNYRELILKEKPEAVSIVVPTSLHKTVAIDCIKLGMHVLVEKPLALNTKDAKEITRYATKQKRILFVGHIERFNPAVISLQKILQKKELGKIISIAIKRVGLPSLRADNVGVVADLAVHDLDIVSHLLKTLPKTITARGASVTKEKKEDHAEIFLDYGTFAGFIQVNWVTPIKIRTLSITGTGGYAELNFITQELFLYTSEKIKNKRLKFNEFVTEFGNPRKKKILVKKGEPLRIELEQFITAVETRRNKFFDPGDAVKAVYLSEIVKDSIKRKKSVEVHYKQ